MDMQYPGTYSREISGATPIESASTSTAAFAGVAQKGPVGTPLIVSSFEEFTSKFGGYLQNSYLAYAVAGFFKNGGGNAVISRAVHYSDDIKTSAVAEVMVGVDPDYSLIVEATSDGEYGNNLEVEIANYDNTEKTFDFIVKYNSVEVEKFPAVNLTEIENLINGLSEYVTVILLDDTLSVPNQTFALAGGADGTVGMSAPDYIKAIHALGNMDFKLLAVPGVTDVSVQVEAATFAGTKNAGFLKNFSIMMSRESMVSELKQNAGLISDRVFAYAGMWGYVSDPIGVGKSPMKAVPLEGHIAGAIATSDNERGVWKAPGGTNLKLQGIVSLFANFDDGDQSILNPEGVNVIRSFDGEGILIWGVRTTDVKGEYRYISSRRLMDYIQDSILKANRWAIFESNGPKLYEKLTANAEEFLRGIWTSGGLAGATEGEAFYVQCNENNNPKSTADRGIVNINIGIADQKPSEFIVHSFSFKS